MRLPSNNGSQHSLDGVWQSRVGMIHKVRIGEPFTIYGPGFGDWHLTTRVVVVRELRDAEIPPQGVIAHIPPDAYGIRGKSDRLPPDEDLDS